MTEAEIIDFNAQRLADERAKAPQWEASDRIRKIRRLQSMTQEDFADAVGVAKGTLQVWEAGMSEPRRLALLELALTCQFKFDIPAWWTLGEAEPSDVLDTDDPRIRATALRVLGMMMTGGEDAVIDHAIETAKNIKKRGVRRQGLEPRTRCVRDYAPVYSLPAAA